MITILLILIAFLLPPLPVAIVCGLSERFWISVVLTLLAWVPGLVYAIYVVLTEEEC